MIAMMVNDTLLQTLSKCIFKFRQRLKFLARFFLCAFILRTFICPLWNLISTMTFVVQEKIYLPEMFINIAVIRSVWVSVKTLALIIEKGENWK